MVKKDGRKGVPAKVRKPARADGRVKATLLLPEDVDFRLGTIARARKIDRSDLAAELLDQGLRKYHLDAPLRLHAGTTGASASSATLEELVTELAALRSMLGQAPTPATVDVEAA